MSLRALQGPTGGGAPVGGSGTSSPSTIPRWTGASTLGDSIIVQNAGGTAIAIGDAAGVSYVGLVQVKRAGGAGWLTLDHTGGSYAEVQSYNVPLYLNRQGNNTILNATSGNVGIGTASPTATSTIYKANNSLGAWNAQDLSVDGLSNGDAVYQRWYATGVAGAVGRFGVTFQSSVASFVWNSLFNSGVQTAELMRLTGGGNLGIGTASPVSRLDVAGTITCDDAGTGLKLPATPGNADTQTLDCYAETTLNSGFTTSGITSTGTFTVTARATKVGRAVAVTIRIAPSGGASLTFASGWNITLTGIPQMPSEGPLAATTADVVVGRGSVQISGDATPILYGGTTGAYALTANVPLNISGFIT